MNLLEAYMLLKIIIAALAEAPAFESDVLAAIEELKTSDDGEQKLKKVLAVVQDLAAKLAAALP